MELEYQGKLYGRLHNDVYFDTGKTSEDWGLLEKRVSELEAENQELRQKVADLDPNKLEKCSNCGDMVNMVSEGYFCPHCWC